MCVLYVCGVGEFWVESEPQDFRVFFSGENVVVYLEGECGVVLGRVGCKECCCGFGGV